MTNRLDALAVREVNGKSYFTKLGVAFETKRGDGWNLLLDAMPAPVEGQFKILLMPPKQKEEGGGTTRYSDHPDPMQRGFVGSSDDIPF